MLFSTFVVANSYPCFIKKTPPWNSTLLTLFANQRILLFSVVIPHICLIAMEGNSALNQIMDEVLWLVTTNYSYYANVNNYCVLR